MILMYTSKTPAKTKVFHARIIPLVQETEETEFLDVPLLQQNPTLSAEETSVTSSYFSRLSAFCVAFQIGIQSLSVACWFLDQKSLELKRIALTNFTVPEPPSEYPTLLDRRLTQVDRLKPNFFLSRERIFCICLSTASCNVFSLFQNAFVPIGKSSKSPGTFSFKQKVFGLSTTCSTDRISLYVAKLTEKHNRKPNMYQVYRLQLKL